MSAILNIGCGEWLCKTAAEAAKISDLLSAAQPLRRDFKNHTRNVFFHGRDHDHETAIMTLPNRYVVIAKSEAEAIKLRPVKELSQSGTEGA